jgi:hypothetical protein
MPGLLNYTTTISAARTITEMQAMLVKAGATAVTLHYDGFGHTTGLTFKVDTKYGPQEFTLTVNTKAVCDILAKMRTRPYSHSERVKLVAAQGERTAWRVARSWLEAQLAMIEIGLASLDQVMLPYMHVGPHQTLYDAYQERQSVLQIEAGS